MHKTKEVLITGFALFSMFFGAGNLVLPPFLGKNAGDAWFIVTVGFFITAVFIPILGILAHAKIQGTMFDFGKKVSPLFSTVYCLIVYAISITLPAPRTASVTHEMAIAPFFALDSLYTSTIYFILVFLFVINRSTILQILGKFLTPLIIFILLAIILIGSFSTPSTGVEGVFSTPFVNGLLEGYQTFDAIGAVVVGGVLVISMNFNKEATFESKKILISKAGLIAGAGLLVIYTGLIFNGSHFSASFTENATRADILSSLSTQTLGTIGTTFLSALVSLACFTTAIGIITGTADYFKGLFPKAPNAFLITAIVGCLLGILMGQFDVKYIIHIALPVLMFIYPITIILILLNVLPNRLASDLVFKVVVFVTFIFSIPDFLQFIIGKEKLSGLLTVIPFAKNHLGWVLPALISFIIVNLFPQEKKKKVFVS